MAGQSGPYTHDYLRSEQQETAAWQRRGGLTARVVCHGPASQLVVSDLSLTGYRVARVERASSIP